MDITPRNDLVSKIIELGEMDDKAIHAYYQANDRDPVANVMAILGAYTYELLTAAKEAGLTLDLTYDTVENIPAAAVVLANKQEANGYDNDSNKRTTCRTIAAYVNLLAINCHNYSLHVNEYSNRRGEVRPERWANIFVIKLNFKKHSDMLQFI